MSDTKPNTQPAPQVAYRYEATDSQASEASQAQITPLDDLEKRLNLLATHRVRQYSDHGLTIVFAPKDSVRDQTVADMMYRLQELETKE